MDLIAVVFDVPVVTRNDASSLRVCVFNTNILPRAFPVKMCLPRLSNAATMFKSDCRNRQQGMNT